MRTRLYKRSGSPWHPHQFQKTAAKFLLEHAAAALFLSPGLGKTAVTLAALKVLKQQGLVRKVLVVAPLRVCYTVWPKEIQKWKDFNKLDIQVLHGPKKQQCLNKDAFIYVINPEGLEWLLGVTKTRTPTGKTRIDLDQRRWRQLGFDTLVVDELSKFKHTQTNRFRALKLVLGTFGRRWGLTGSPVANGLMDLFGQCYVLDEGRSLGRYITHYRHQYFERGYDGFSWSLRPGAEDEIYDRLRPLALQMGDELIDMPKLVENRIRVTLPEAAREVYDRLEQDLIARLEDGVVTAKTAAVAGMKCHQVANGAIYPDEEVVALVRLPTPRHREWVKLHDAKLDALEELVGELQGAPLLVAYNFHHDLDRLRARFGLDVPHIGGGVSAKQSVEIVQAWNRGNLPLLFGHPQAMGHGMNLQGASCHVAWFSLTWDYELYDQFIRRVRRQGNQADRVYVHSLVAAETIDEVIISALRSKRSGQQALFHALKNNYLQQ